MLGNIFLRAAISLNFTGGYIIKFIPLHLKKIKCYSSNALYINREATNLFLKHF